MAENDRFSVLDERQTVAVARLAEGRKGSEVAREIGVDARTLRRWKLEPAFAAVLAEAQADVLAAAQTRLDASLDAALDTICAVMGDETAPHAARLRAAELILARTIDTARKNEIAAEAPIDVKDALEFLRWKQKGEGNDAA